MKAEVRRKMDMALRVRDFNRAHPFPDPEATAVVTRFDDRLTRVEALAVDQRGNQLAARAANVRRNQLRNLLLMQLLRHLVRVAEDAATELVDLRGKILLPPQNASHQAFLTAARGMVSEATAHRDLMVKHG